MHAVPTTAVVILAVLLAGCSADPAPANGPSESGSASPTPSTAGESAAEVFAMPTACLDILPQQRLDEFGADGLVLLGGPDGEYGDEYLLDPSPEQRAGGITCIWGPPDTEISTVAISVAPLAASARPGIVSDLAVSQGLNETVSDRATYYWQLGDLDHQPAILNVLTAESWVSIIKTVGGTDSYADAERLAAEVLDLVYR
jgi:hypothetical protein